MRKTQKGPEGLRDPDDVNGCSSFNMRHLGDSTGMKPLLGAHIIISIKGYVQRIRHRIVGYLTVDFQR